jgi:hypothetical protein
VFLAEPGGGDDGLSFTSACEIILLITKRRYFMAIHSYQGPDGNVYYADTDKLLHHVKSRHISQPPSTSASGGSGPSQFNANFLGAINRDDFRDALWRVACDVIRYGTGADETGDDGVTAVRALYLNFYNPQSPANFVPPGFNRIDGTNTWLKGVRVIASETPCSHGTHQVETLFPTGKLGQMG